MNIQIQNKLHGYDSKIFLLIYSKYKKAIYYEVLKKILNPDIAKDLCQEIFIKVWKNLYKYQAEKGKMYTWLINIAKNHCIDYFRSPYFSNNRATSLIDNNLSVSPNSIYSDKITVKQLLSYLKKDQREIIELLFIEGLSHTQVSKIKNMPLGSVKSKSRIAITRLKFVAGVSQN